MNLLTLSCLVLLTTVIVAIVDTKDNDTSDTALSNDQGTGRLMLWRLLPQYQDVDIAANFNKLKSSGDAAYFVVRDTIVVRKQGLSLLFFLLVFMFSILGSRPCGLSSILSYGMERFLTMRTWL